MSLTVYSFSKVSCIMNGIPIVDWMDGDDVVKITRSDDVLTPLVGADGEAIVSISNDESAIIDLKLKPSSISNTVLAALELKFRKGFRVPPVGFAVTDYQTAAVYASSTAVVLSKPKDVQFGKNATARTWQIFCGKLTEGTIGQL